MFPLYDRETPSCSVFDFAVTCACWKLKGLCSFVCSNINTLAVFNRGPSRSRALAERRGAGRTARARCVCYITNSLNAILVHELACCPSHLAYVNRPGQTVENNRAL